MKDKQRAEFERWFKENHTKNVQKVNGEYVHGVTERLWQAWKAALESVIVELPELEKHDRDAVTEKPEEAGIRYEQ